jgi:hypothetical protein
MPIPWSQSNLEEPVEWGPSEEERDAVAEEAHRLLFEEDR